MILRGLCKLTWIEIKVFLREPLGAIGTIGVPVLIFVVLGRVTNHKFAPSSFPGNGLSGAGLPVLVSLLIAISAVLSLVTIISIYREGGILKRLRATPLRPFTILTAHVIVKLMLTAATLTLMLMAGRRYFPPGAHVPWFSFTIALMISTWSILSVGFLIASIVPTARFAQPIGAIILYPMIAVSGLFVPVEALPPGLHAVARALPLTYAVNLLKGIWNGDRWFAHVGDVAAMTVLFLFLRCSRQKSFAGSSYLLRRLSLDSRIRCPRPTHAPIGFVRFRRSSLNHRDHVSRQFIGLTGFAARLLFSDIFGVPTPGSTFLSRCASCHRAPSSKQEASCLDR